MAPSPKASFSFSQLSAGNICLTGYPGAFRRRGHVSLLPASTLIRDGRLIERNLRKEMITEEELKSQLREQNVEDLAEIKLATLEGDGRLSVLKRK